MWGTTLIIDSLAPGTGRDNLRVKQEDTLILSWEERRWTRGRFTTAQGRRIGIALPTGTALTPGAILHIADDWYLKIEAAMEPVLEIVPADYKEAVKIAFEVGNRHFPLALEENKILVPDDKGMIRLMDRLGVAWKKRQAIFNPISNTQLQPHGSFS
jgi:urease accessory protein